MATAVSCGSAHWNKQTPFAGKEYWAFYPEGTGLMQQLCVNLHWLSWGESWVRPRFPDFSYPLCTNRVQGSIMLRFLWQVLVSTFLASVSRGNTCKTSLKVWRNTESELQISHWGPDVAQEQALIGDGLSSARFFARKPNKLASRVNNQINNHPMWKNKNGNKRRCFCKRNCDTKRRRKWFNTESGAWTIKWRWYSLKVIRIKGGRE